MHYVRRITKIMKYFSSNFFYRNYIFIYVYSAKNNVTQYNGTNSIRMIVHLIVDLMEKNECHFRIFPSHEINLAICSNGKSSKVFFLYIMEKMLRLVSIFSDYLSIFS